MYYFSAPLNGLCGLCSSVCLCLAGWPGRSTPPIKPREPRLGPIWGLDWGSNIARRGVTQKKKKAQFPIGRAKWAECRGRGEEACSPLSSWSPLSLGLRYGMEIVRGGVAMRRRRCDCSTYCDLGKTWKVSACQLCHPGVQARRCRHPSPWKQERGFRERCPWPLLSALRISFLMTLSLSKGPMRRSIKIMKFQGRPLSASLPGEVQPKGWRGTPFIAFLTCNSLGGERNVTVHQSWEFRLRYSCFCVTVGCDVHLFMLVCVSAEDEDVMDDLMVDWFNLIRNKQVYMRRESELVYM